MRHHGPDAKATSTPCGAVYAYKSPDLDSRPEQARPQTRPEQGTCPGNGTRSGQRTDKHQHAMRLAQHYVRRSPG